MKTLLMKRFILLCLTGCVLSLVIAAASAVPAAAAEDWKETFNLVCGSVQGAESMSEKEITAMIEKADKLKPAIETSDDPGKKVYLKRLKSCRGVYEFMLDTKKGSGK